jgi:hypothetical protein
MARPTESGSFYEFDRERDVSDQIGRKIPRSQALLRIRSKRDVYTPASSDAKSLAKDVVKGAPGFHGAHETFYYAHFHPGFDNDNYGHIFFGQPGLKHRLMQRAPGGSRIHVPKGGAS